MGRLLLIASALALYAHPTAAQVGYLHPSAEPTVGVEVSRAFGSLDELSWYTSMVRGRFFLPIGETAHFIGDLGLSVAGSDFGSDATFANPEVGVGVTNAEGQMRFMLTAVLPLGFGIGDDDLSAATGVLTDFFWLDRYVDDLMSINAAFTPRAEVGPNTELMADVYLSAMIPTDDGDSELFSRYAFGIHQDVRLARIRAAIEGLAVLSEADLSLGERTLHRIVLAAERSQGGPGFFVRIPIDEELDDSDVIAGLTFTF